MQSKFNRQRKRDANDALHTHLGAEGNVIPVTKSPQADKTALNKAL
jgi:hypothetical protein